MIDHMYIDRQQHYLPQGKTNPEKGEESDFQNYDIIRFKCILNVKKKKNKRNRKIWLIQNNIPTETISEKDFTVDVLDKDFTITV